MTNHLSSKLLSYGAITGKVRITSSNKTSERGYWNYASLSGITKRSISLSRLDTGTHQLFRLVSCARPSQTRTQVSALPTTQLKLNESCKSSSFHVVLETLNSLEVPGRGGNPWYAELGQKKTCCYFHNKIDCTHAAWVIRIYFLSTFVIHECCNKIDY